MHSGSGVFNTECLGCDGCFTLPAPVPGSFFPGHWFLAWRLADKSCPGLPSEEGNAMCFGDQTMGFLIRQPPFCEENLFTLANGWNHLSPRVSQPHTYPPGPSQAPSSFSAGPFRHLPPHTSQVGLTSLAWRSQRSAWTSGHLVTRILGQDGAVALPGP